MIRDVPSARTLWIGDSDDDRVFVVLDPDVKNVGAVAAREPGSRVTLLGLVRAAPTDGDGHTPVETRRRDGEVAA